MKSRKKKRGGLKLLLSMLLLGALVFGVYRGYQVYGPSSEYISEAELFGVSGDRTAIMYNYELQSAYALCRNGEAYFPVEWVQTILNKRFYWDEEETLLVYALPDQIVKMTYDSMDETGKALFFMEENKLWLSASLIQSYTDIRMEPFLDEDVKRIFVGTWEEADTVAGTRGKTVLRSRPSRKGDIVAAIQKNERLRYIPDHPNATTDTERWQRVMTADGRTGYVSLRKMFQTEEIAVDNSFVAPEYTSLQMENNVLLGWHQVTTAEANQYLGKMTEKAAGLNVVSPTWFSLRGNEGDYVSLASRSYVDAAHAKGLQVWALLDNFDSSVTLGTMLKRTSVRERLIAGLMEEAERCNLDGINIDFELLRKDAVKQYLQFMRELSVACRVRGLYLSVDVPNPASYNWHYDREELGVFCDYVINMGYDEHTSGDEMGSTASLGFFAGGIERSLKEIPKEKLVAGLPFYTRIWKKAKGNVLTSEAVTMRKAAEWIDQYQIPLSWDDSVGQYTGKRVTDDGSIQYIWMEDTRSLELKINEIRKNDIAGTACWRLGQEDEAVWELMGGI